MPRTPRRVEPGIIYHVLNRAGGPRKLFQNKHDFDAFQQVICDAVSRYRVELLGWCIMDDHWHLLVRPLTKNALSECMRWIGVTHVRRHQSHRNKRGGSLYRERFKSFPVSDDEHFLMLCRYVESNPLRAGKVGKSEAWEWSSLHQRKNRIASPPLAEWPVDRPANWVKLVNTAMNEQDAGMLRQCIIRDRPLGPAKWVERIARRLGIEQTLRPIGRPRKPVATLSARQRQRREHSGRLTGKRKK